MQEYLTHSEAELVLPFLIGKNLKYALLYFKYIP